LWLDRLQNEYSNLRSALEWCVEAPGRGDRGLELAAALSWFWLKRGYLGEGRQWLERALAADGGAPRGLQAEAFNGLGTLTFFLGDYAATRQSLETSMALGREAGDMGQVATSLGLQAILALETGDIARSARLAAEGRIVATASGEPWRQAPALECLAYEAMHAGDYDRACTMTEEALELLRNLGDKWAIAIHLSDLAVFRLLQGHYEQTEALCAEAIALCHEWADRLLIAYCLAYLAGAHAAQDRGLRAARLWGAMHGLLESVASPLQESVKTLIGDRYMDRVKESLGQEAFHAALAEGRAMSLTQAVQYALAETS